MTTTPDYLNQTEDGIRQRMLDSLPSDLDKAEGSYIWDSIAPAAIELFVVSLLGQDILSKGFASTASSPISGFRSPYLDLRTEEHGVFRRTAVKASQENGVEITGKIGTIVPIGTKFATPADPVTNTPSIEFESTNEITLEATKGFIDIRAIEGGISGNVPAGAISILVSQIQGITAITNPEPITGGLDEEEDLALLARYLQRVRNPSSSGNRADYVAWALEVSGVGGVSVIPVRDGPGTVSVGILNQNMEPADQMLVDKVQNYIAPPHVLEQEAENMTMEGYGVSIDDTQVDDSGDSVKMIYDTGGNGVIIHRLETLLPQLGIWQARVKVKADVVTGGTDLLQIGVWNVSGSSWSMTTPLGSMDAVKTFKGNELTTGFNDITVEFYWNGQDQIEIQVSRLTTDGSTMVWVDYVVFHSTFSRDDGDGKAPIGARVTVEPAMAVLINISAILVISSGYNAESVKSAAIENIRTYIKSLAFAQDNDVRYVRIGEKILDTPGIYDFSYLTVNGGSSNIPIESQEVAVLGTVTFTT